LFQLSHQSEVVGLEVQQACLEFSIPLLDGHLLGLESLHLLTLALSG
jgi:hypothetical protein